SKKKTNMNRVKVIETVDLTSKEPSEPLGCSSIMNSLELSDLPEVTTFISLVCYDQFEKPHKKLDGALAIPYNITNLKSFGDIEAEILSRNLPENWGKVELGHICYQISNIMKADQYDLKANEPIVAFIAEIKNKKCSIVCLSRK
ncbi:34902_t:CDS:2, partial [Gigaspora margarita]